MTMYGVDISNWQKGYNVANANPDFCILKATEGLNYVDKTCDGFVQQCINNGTKWGFYHFARNNDAAAEARFFRDNTKGYETHGIPVLDFEDTRLTTEWMEIFVKEYYAITHVYPWIYMNASFVNDRNFGNSFLKNHCGLWLAGYPKNYTTYPENIKCPYRLNGWTLAAWQFTDKLNSGGMSVDGDIAYLQPDTWDMYAKGENTDENIPVEIPPKSDWELARECIDGKYGNGAARHEALGNRYNAVQAKVNMLIHGNSQQIAIAVINGELGNGEKRKYILGSRYNEIQTEVNAIMR